MLEIYQHFPENINPIIFQIGFFSIKWYSIMYLVGFVVVYVLLKHRIWEITGDKNQKPASPAGGSKIKNQNNPLRQRFNEASNVKCKNCFLQIDVLSLLLYLISGLLIGARLGYVLFYDLNYFFNHPLEIFLPIRVTSFGLQVTEISGMSYFGGLIGVIAAGLIFCKKHKVNFWQLADFVVPAVPAGYFFGRIGNFLNGELYGRATSKFWGMYFPADPENLLRHPSQLYEAFFEGFVLFIILWLLRNIKTCHPELVSGSKKLSIRFRTRFAITLARRVKSGMTSDGFLLILYIFLYGISRFFVEFFREPDPGTGLIFGWLTIGQVFSAIAIAVAFFIVLIRRKRDTSQDLKNNL